MTIAVDMGGKATKTNKSSEGSHSIDDFAPYHVSEKLKLSFFVKGSNFFSKLGKIGNTDKFC